MLKFPIGCAKLDAAHDNNAIDKMAQRNRGCGKRPLTALLPLVSNAGRVLIPSTRFCSEAGQLAFCDFRMQHVKLRTNVQSSSQENLCVVEVTKALVDHAGMKINLRVDCALL